MALRRKIHGSFGKKLREIALFILNDDFISGIAFEWRLAS
jgi:hypothetical protein